MAELASGAVSALLGVIRNEQRLLGGVKGDVQFIKEEMESMNSFLLHLARTVPTSGEHDEQVRTWMSQVRLLAQDCNNYIDLYLYRGNPDIHLDEGGLWRCLQLAPWFLRKLTAQHRAATQLRELKERARDVGKRRLRYGVEVPGKKAAAAAASGQQSPSTGALAASVQGAGDEEQDDGGDLVVAEHSSRSRAFEPCSWEDYMKQKLEEWMEDTNLLPIGFKVSIAIVAPGTHQEDEACALAREALDKLEMCHVLVDIPAVHDEWQPVRPQDILYYILRELELQAQAKQQQEATYSGHDQDDATQPKAKQQEATSSGHDQADATQPEAKQHEATSSGHDQDDATQHEAKQQEATSGHAQDDARTKPEAKQQEASTSSDKVSEWSAARERRKYVYRQLTDLLNKINHDIQGLKVHDKLEGVKEEIEQVKGEQLQRYLGQKKDNNQEPKIISKEPLGLLLMLLNQAGKKRAKCTVAPFYEDIIRATGSKLGNLMEAGKNQPISLYREQYEQIMQEKFPMHSDSNAQEHDQEITTTTLREDHIKEIANKVKKEILREVMTGNSKALQHQDQEHDSLEAKSATAFTTLGEDHSKEDREILNSMVQETKEKIDSIKRRIEELMEIKAIVDKMGHLEDYTMIILKVGHIVSGSVWEETRKALSPFNGLYGALIITTKKCIDPAEKYCNPTWQPIQCSLVGLYHTTMLNLISEKLKQDKRKTKLLRDILGNCEQHEFCMRIFAHAIYSKPTRSYEELYNLCRTLQEVSPKTLSTISQKMIRFSYNDMTKEQQSCLLYLAIYPQGYKMRRSDLIGRWAVEGLIMTEDWSWHSSVEKAERCFETLINRWLVYPAKIGVSGDVKSCTVGELVYEFITTLAKKQRTLHMQLSHHLARHFSISNDLRLRGSDKVQDFFDKLSESSRFSLLKVLDLENCQCFYGKNKRHLKIICCKILLLKYLSLRGTDLTDLPNEINKLHELEVLDIRHTKVPESATKNIRLLKLKRLLAGQIGTTFKDEGQYPSSVLVPDKIEKMHDMEVLCNVRALSDQALKGIGRCNLRKLGVVIEEKDSRLQSLLEAISNMHEFIRSLSITVCKGTRSSRRTQSSANNDYGLKDSIAVLESLSINGTSVQLLKKLLDKVPSKLATVTLRDTWLKQDELNVLDMLPNLLCLRLGDNSYTDRKLTFKNNQFKNLKYFYIEGSNMTEMSFEREATFELEKIVLSITDKLHTISGVEGLSKMKELELNDCKLLPLFDKANQIAKVTLSGNVLKEGDLEMLTRKPNIHYLALLGNCYDKITLTFNKDEFPKLKLLSIDSSCTANISFNRESTPNLKKIIWSVNKKGPITLSGIDNLPRLMELELNGDLDPSEVKKAIKRHKNKPTLEHNKPKTEL